MKQLIIREFAMLLWNYLVTHGMPLPTKDAEGLVRELCSKHSTYPVFDLKYVLRRAREVWV